MNKYRLGNYGTIMKGNEDFCQYDEPYSLISELNDLERQLEKAREEKKNLEKLVDDFDGAVRYIMVVAPQLDSIMKRNIGRIKKLKEKGDEF
jgi:hypothetical protein